MTLEELWDVIGNVRTLADVKRCLAEEIPRYFNQGLGVQCRYLQPWSKSGIINFLRGIYAE